MSAWILIILLHGWGAGIGSTGNMAATAEFSSQQTCEAAAERVNDAIHKSMGVNGISSNAFCMRK